MQRPVTFSWPAVALPGRQQLTRWALLPAKFGAMVALSATPAPNLRV